MSSSSEVFRHEERIELLPEALRERAWKLADQGTSVERRHNEALRLIHDLIIFLTSLAFAEYRRRRFDAPDERVERALLRFDRPFLSDYCSLLRLSLAAVPESSASQQLTSLKVDDGMRLQRAMRALDQAVAARASRVSEFLDAGAPPTKRASLQDVLQTVIAYRNGALGHQESTGWTDLTDFYSNLTPIVDRLAVNLLCHDAVYGVVTGFPTGTLLNVELTQSAEYAHRCVIDHDGRRQRRTIHADARITDLWQDARWRAEEGGRVLMCAHERGFEILAPLHDFASGEPPPQPLLLPQEIDRQTAVVGEVLRQTWAHSRDEHVSRWIDSTEISKRVGLEHEDVKIHLASLSSVLEGHDASSDRLAEGTRASWRSAALRRGLGYVVAVEFGHEDLGVSFTDLDGTALTQAHRERARYREFSRDPLSAVRLAALEVDRLRREMGIDAERVFAISVAVAACVRNDDDTEATDDDVIARASGFPEEWTDFAPGIALKQALREEAGWSPEVIVGNDANLAALAEATWGSGRDSNGLIYIEWSEGIGGGFIIDGELYAGAHGGAAEFGHYRVDVSAPFPCSSGHLNCLEAVTSTAAMLAQAQAQSSDQPPEDFEEFWALVREGNPRYSHILARAASRVGATLAPIVAALDPDMIVLGGAFSGDEVDLEILRGPLIGGIEERLPVGAQLPELRMSSLGEDAVLQGAATQGLAQFGGDFLVAAAKRALTEN